MRNFKLTIAYDGTMYHGWQAQENVITVQKVIEDCLFEVMKEKVSVCGCSRTDAGVHAKMYVLNFSSSCNIPFDKVAIAMNTKLPPDIRAICCKEVSTEFNARFDTVSKTYKYFINNGEYDIFKKNYEWYFPKKLNIDAMQSAAKYIIGEHYFDSFAAAGNQTENTLRKVNFLNIKKDDKNIIEIEINANSFLYNMVRIITGTLLYVGLNRFLPEYVQDIIELKDRKYAGITAPAKGLFLWEVFYGDYTEG